MDRKDFRKNPEVFYEKYTFGTPGGKIISFIEKKSVLRFLDLQFPQVVLDLGSGTGRISQELVKRGTTVVGVDISRPRIQIAREKTGRNGFLGVVADGQFLPFKNEVFDRIVCIRVFKYFRNFHLGISEMTRVLKSKGILVIELSNVFGYETFWRLLTFKDLKRPALYNFYDVRNSLVWSNLTVLESVPLHKIPTKLWINFKSLVAFHFLSAAESVLQRLTPTVFLSRGILLKCMKQVIGTAECTRVTKDITGIYPKILDKKFQ